MSQRTEAEKGKYITDVFAREAVGFLQRYLGKQPVFLYLAFNAPHSASSFPDAEGKRPGVQAPEEYVAQYRGLAKADALARYFAAVTCMDAAIGRVLQTLDDAGQAENTLVIFLSDNGGSGNGGNAPLRGAKATMWEGGLRVPFLFRWPAQVPAGRVTDEFLTALEILPTLLAATGAAVLPISNSTASISCRSCAASGLRRGPKCFGSAAATRPHVAATGSGSSRPTAAGCSTSTPIPARRRISRRASPIRLVACASGSQRGGVRWTRRRRAVRFATTDLLFGCSLPHGR